MDASRSIEVAQLARMRGGFVVDGYLKPVLDDLLRGP